MFWIWVYCLNPSPSDEDPFNTKFFPVVSCKDLSRLFCFLSAACNSAISPAAVRSSNQGIESLLLWGCTLWNNVYVKCKTFQTIYFCFPILYKPATILQSYKNVVTGYQKSS